MKPEDKLLLLFSVLVLSSLVFIALGVDGGIVLCRRLMEVSWWYGRTELSCTLPPFPQQLSPAIPNAFPIRWAGLAEWAGMAEWGCSHVTHKPSVHSWTACCGR